MKSPWCWPATLESLYLVALVKAYLRRQDPRRRKSGRHLEAFYERVWREAAEQLGAAYRALGGGFGDITLGGARVRTIENTCSIDDPVTLVLASNKRATYRLLEE